MPVAFGSTLHSVALNYRPRGPTIIEILFYLCPLVNANEPHFLSEMCVMLHTRTCFDDADLLGFYRTIIHPLPSKNGAIPDPATFELYYYHLTSIP